MSHARANGLLFVNWEKYSKSKFKIKILL